MTHPAETSLPQEPIMSYAEPTFDTDLDVEGFRPTVSETETITADVDRIRPLVEEFPTQILHI